MQTDGSVARLVTLRLGPKGILTFLNIAWVDV
jgi:hypothetical protein